MQTNTDILFPVDVASREITRVAIEGADLLFADGLLLIGDHVYVARNAKNELVCLALAPGWRSARGESTFSGPQLAFPTALAELRGRLLVTNAQLDAGADAILPFTVLDLPLAVLGGSG